MPFKKGDPKTIEAARKGNKSRKNPYYNFRALKEADPEKLKELQRKGGQTSC